jgi:hypothetical protein
LYDLGQEVYPVETQFPCLENNDSNISLCFLGFLGHKMALPSSVSNRSQTPLFRITCLYAELPRLKMLEITTYCKLNSAHLQMLALGAIVDSFQISSGVPKTALKESRALPGFYFFVYLTN